MRFVEVDLLGVYVAPISVMLVVAWVLTMGLRRVVARFGLFSHVWHPALFVASVYVIILGAMTAFIAR
jgi:protein AaeX